MVYFVTSSSLEKEIKYKYSLNNAQHYRLKQILVLWFKKCMLKNIPTNEDFFLNHRIDIYLKPILTYLCYVIKYFYHFKNSIIL